MSDNPFTKYSGGAAPPAANDNPFARYAPKPPEAPHTTAGGLAGATTRGIAPYALGGIAGGAVAGPPGAAVGAGVVAGVQGLESLYNMAAGHFGWPEAPTPEDMTNRLADAIGIKKPSTPAERMTQRISGDIASAAGAMTPTHELAEAIAGNNAAKAEQYIRKTFDRTVKPRGGVQNATKLADYGDSALDAVKSIIGNKANLRFTNEIEEIAGQSPETLEQFSEAIDQTKRGIFLKYDTMARRAGDAGARVNLLPSIVELDKVANSSVVKDFYPELAKHATELAARLAERGSYSVLEAQDAVQKLNNSLKAFYASPSYETATRAGVDAIVANQMRQGLDATVRGISGPGYQELKNQYGALSAIEKDVANRARVVARQEMGGGILGRLADTASAEEFFRGVFTLNPTAIARAAALRGWRSYVQYLRDPNRAVKKMFEEGEKLYGGRDAAVSEALPYQTGGLQPPRPAGGPVTPSLGPQPPLQGGVTMPALPPASAAPRQLPPQMPQSDFEAVLRNTEPF